MPVTQVATKQRRAPAPRSGPRASKLRGRRRTPRRATQGAKTNGPRRSRPPSERAAGRAAAGSLRRSTPPPGCPRWRVPPASGSRLPSARLVDRRDRRGGRVRRGAGDRGDAGREQRQRPAGRAASVPEAMDTLSPPGSRRWRRIETYDPFDARVRRPSATSASAVTRWRCGCRRPGRRAGAHPGARRARGGGPVPRRGPPGAGRAVRPGVRALGSPETRTPRNGCATSGASLGSTTRSSGRCWSGAGAFRQRRRRGRATSRRGCHGPCRRGGPRGPRGQPSGDAGSAEALRDAAERIGIEEDGLRELLFEYPHAAVSRPRASEPSPLSVRELDALRGLAEGKVYKQIAQELSLSVSTVRTHLHNVYRKIGAVDRAQAVLIARDRGWI